MKIKGTTWECEKCHCTITDKLYTVTLGKTKTYNVCFPCSAKIIVSRKATKLGWEAVCIPLGGE